MLKNNLSIILLSLAFCSQSQIQKGNLLIGGTGSLSYRNINKSGYADIRILPNAGIFITDNIAVGTGLQLSFSIAKSTFGSTVGISPFARYYFMKKEKAAFFVPLNIGIYSTTFKFDNNSNKTNYTGFSGSVGLGYTYFINPSIGLETSILYSYTQDHNNILAISTNQHNNVGVNIGFQIYLNRQK